MDRYIDLKLFRKENGLKQTEVAVVIGLDQGSMSRFERGCSIVDELKYRKLCEKYGQKNIDKYVCDNPINNKKQTKTKLTYEDLKDIIKSQAETIEHLSELVKCLTQKVAS